MLLPIGLASTLADNKHWEVSSKDDFSSHNTSLNLSQAELPGLQLYPNPCAEQLNILLPSFEGALSFQIINSQGALVQTGQIKSGSQLKTFDVQELPKSFYFSKLIGAEKSLVGRFVKI